METGRVDWDRMSLADRRLSRRTALRAGAASLAAATLVAADLARPTRAQDATPEPPPPTADATPATESVPDLTGVAPLPLTGERLAAFEAYVAAMLAEVGVPGASVAVVQGGAVAFLDGFGVRELGRAAPVTADTLLRIGSVTKSFSSLLTATLVDAGRLTWETPLVDLLPTFAVADADLTPRLTVGDAFCACSGLPRRDWEFIFNARTLDPERMVAAMAELPLTAPYGEKFQYNNQLVATGGFAAAVADGGSPNDLGAAYAIALRARVLNPIGMPRTTLRVADVLADGDYATPHGADLAGAFHPLPLLEDDTWIVPVEPTGALWSSAREMARYVQTELARGVSPDGTRVVSAANLERTWQPGVAFPPAPPGTPAETATFSQHYALGWFTGAFGGQRLVWHSGATMGFTSLVTLLPDADFGIVVLTNGEASVATPFTYAVTIRLLELLFDLPAAFDAIVTAGLAAAAQGRADLVAQLGPVDPAAITPYLGRYANPALGEASLSLRGEALFFEAGGYQAELRSQLGADGAVIAYRPVDAPLAGFLPPTTITFPPGADGSSQLVLTIKDDQAQDLVYPFLPVGPVATPAP